MALGSSGFKRSKYGEEAMVVFYCDCGGWVEEQVVGWGMRGSWMAGSSRE